MVEELDEEVLDEYEEELDEEIAEENDEEQEKRKRIKKPFPACPFEESLEFAKEIEKKSGKQPIRRFTLFNEIGKSPSSGPSRMLIINSNKYGLTTGSYKSDYLQLTEEGYNATSDEVSPRIKAKAKVNLAIINIEILKQLYEQNLNQKLPAHAVLVDKAKELGIEEEQAEELINLFIENLKFVGLLKVLSGAERIITLDYLLDELPTVLSKQSVNIKNKQTENTCSEEIMNETGVNFEKTCFYITPIGEEESEIRNHADLFYGTFIEPIAEKFNLELVRADRIDKPGFITKQIIEYISKSKLVIADLSFNNPNVFYELAIRHTKGLPVVQIMRTQDKIPFDINQLRTIKIDCSSIYKLVPQIDSYISQISNQVKKALEETGSSDNPITQFSS